MRPEYESELRSLLGAVLADEAARARAEELVAARPTRWAGTASAGPGASSRATRLGPGRGAVPLMALLAVLPEVDRSLRERGIDDDARAATLGEIRRQVDKTVRLTGRPGLSDYSWVETVWRGGFAQLGRLQYELIREDEGWVLNTHIPAEGSDGTRRGARLAGPRPRDHAGRVSRGRTAARGRLSFVAVRPAAPRAAARLQHRRVRRLVDITPGESGSGDAEGLYFVFDLPRDASRLDVLLPTLTATSRLQAALLDMWRGGGHLAVGSGRLVFRSRMLGHR